MTPALRRPLTAATLAAVALGVLAVPLSGASSGTAPAALVSRTEGDISVVPAGPPPAAGSESAPRRSLLAASSVAAADDYSFLSGRTATPARWDPCDPVDYRINTTAGPRDAAALVLHAVREVERATGLVFRYRGTSTFVPTRTRTTEPGIDLSIAFAAPEQSDLWAPDRAPAGLAGMSWRLGAVTADGRSAGKAQDGRVLLNADDFAQFDRWIDAGSHAPDYVRGVHLMARQVVLHELAHAVGLGHASGEGRQVMAPVARPDGVVTGWGAGDLAGLRLLGAEQGCLAATPAEAAAGAVPAAEPGPAVPAWQPVVRVALGEQASADSTPASAPAAPEAAPAPAPVPVSIGGPRTVKRGTNPVLVVKGAPRSPYVLYLRSAGSTRFGAVHRGTLGANGTASVAIRTTRDFRYYAVVAGRTTGAGLTQIR